MFEIQSKYNDKVIQVNIPQRHKVICVNVSGGADSALLLYKTMQYQKETNNRFKIIAYTSAGRTRTFFNFYHASKVQYWITDQTQFEHNLSWCTFKRRDTNTSAQYSHFKIIAMQHQATLFVSGRTAWPPKDELPPYWQLGDDLKLSKAEAQSYTRNSNMNPYQKYGDDDPKAHKWFKPNSYFYMPFISVDKKWIWGSYKHYGIEALWNATRSCEGYQQILQPSCQECWWCKEREWAKY
jgi:hypothetical protein